MNKREREWVAMLLAELCIIGLGDISMHYYDVLVRMDPLIVGEYKACLRTFNVTKKESAKDDNG